MLPGANRLTRSVEFRRCIRSGARGGSRTLTVHLLHGHAGSGEMPEPPRVGLVVSKAVGNAVTRNRVSRRLRHLAAPALHGLGPGTLLVIRAQPAAGAADSSTLAQDLQQGLETALRHSRTVADRAPS